MKKSLVLLMATTLFTHAAQIQFALSPAGTDNAMGLSPSNEVPPATNSTGSGNIIGGGIYYNTDTSIIHVELGYGSAAGFSNLTGPASAMHIHCCAPQGSNAPVLVNLLPYNISTNPALGGIVIGDIPYPSNSVPALLAGLAYINIHTPTYPGGEIRGQLIQAGAPPSTNNPPSIACAPSATVECGTSATVSAIVSDPNGDALTVVWTLDGTAVLTNTVAAGTSSAATTVSFSTVFALGTHTLSTTVTDSGGNSASCATAITVVDTTPPVIDSVSASPRVLWPPNHKMKDITVQAHVTDTCGSATWKILSVSSNESNDNDQSADFEITGDHTVKVRAERNGSGSGRVYTITIQGMDQAGNTALATITVSVPHDQRHHGKPNREDSHHGNQGDQDDQGNGNGNGNGQGNGNGHGHGHGKK